MGIHRITTTPRDTMLALHARLRDVRVLCGDFIRALAPAVTLFEMNANFPVGVFLDPPYAHNERNKACYGDHDDATASGRARAWALEHGDHPRMRIVLAGYEGEHQMPPSWRCVAWKAHGGMGLNADGRGRENRLRERLWLSPACLDATRQRELFA
jgi:hypothetical protein